MAFNSYIFVLLFAITVLFYYKLAYKYRKNLLLLSSAIFIGYAHLGFLGITVILSTITYAFGRWIESIEEEKPKSIIFSLGLIINIVFLCSFKYLNFIEDNIIYLLSNFNIEYSPIFSHIFLPLGISFYIFQAISYLIEVYWEEQDAEKDYGVFLLYMLFFMKFVSGPIERPQDFIPQIKKIKVFNYPLAISGLQLIAIGLFKKLVIADRLAPYLDDVFTSVSNYSGAQLLLVTILYPIQLYADFSAYTDMAIGGARILGFELSPNFNRPFIAKTITDFWRRWHISLSFWVRDYIYAPIATNRRRWGIWGIMYALLLTFIILGLWHGASWNFVIYGAIQGIVVCYEMKSNKWRNKFIKTLPKTSSFVLIIRTYLIFSASLLFFRIEQFSDVLYVFTHIFDGISTSYKELNLGMSDHNIIVFAIATLSMFIYEMINDKKPVFEYINKKHTIIRWTTYYALAIIIAVFGVFNSGDFIYLQF